MGSRSGPAELGRSCKGSLRTEQRPEDRVRRANARGSFCLAERQKTIVAGTPRWGEARADPTKPGRCGGDFGRSQNCYGKPWTGLGLERDWVDSENWKMATHSLEEFTFWKGRDGPGTDKPVCAESLLSYIQPLSLVAQPA